jgi:hypothetical protein
MQNAKPQGVKVNNSQQYLQERTLCLGIKDKWKVVSVTQEVEHFWHARAPGFIPCTRKKTK